MSFKTHVRVSLHEIRLRSSRYYFIPITHVETYGRTSLKIKKYILDTSIQTHVRVSLHEIRLRNSLYYFILEYRVETYGRTSFENQTFI